LTPKMVNVGQHPNIHLMTYSEVEGVSGSMGNFKVKIRRKPRYIEENKCSGCGICYSKCPAVRIPHRRVIKAGEQVIKEVR